MNKILDKLFLSCYTGSRAKEYIYAKSTVIIIVGMIALLILGMVIGSQGFIMYIAYTCIFLINFILLLLIRKGHQKIVGIILTSIMTVFFMYILMINPITNQSEIYTIVFLESLVMFSTLLITTSAIHVIVCTVLTQCGIYYVYFFRVLPAVRAGQFEASINSSIIASFIILFNMFIVITSNKRQRTFLEKAEKESLVNEERATRLESTVKNMQSDFNTGENLVHYTVDLTKYVSEIEEQMESAHKEMESLGEQTINVKNASGSIVESSHIVSEAVENQTAIIEETSSAVTEMSSSLSNISDIASERIATIESLRDKSEETANSIMASTDAINNLKSFVSSLSEITDVINNIASQTNLLAMNAAIEAAHAGNSGRGFAVVADEIRKLSETSSENVKNISYILKDITTAIHQSTTINEKAMSSFQIMESDILQVIDGMREITTGINELAVGTRQINAGTAQSVSSTTEVKTSMQQVNIKIEDITGEMSELEKTVTNMSSRFKEILNALNKIKSETGNIKSIGDDNIKNLKKLQSELSQR